MRGSLLREMLLFSGRSQHDARVSLVARVAKPNKDMLFKRLRPHPSGPAVTPLTPPPKKKAWETAPKTNVSFCCITWPPNSILCAVELRFKEGKVLSGVDGRKICQMSLHALDIRGGSSFAVTLYIPVSNIYNTHSWLE